MILITGSAGLIGTALQAVLENSAIEYRCFDIAESPLQDTRNEAAIEAALDGVTGVVHLAAISRVVWAERDPSVAQAVNVGALETLLGSMARRSQSPWLIFASSREIYGEQPHLPVGEDADLLPINTYGRTKLAGEDLVNEAREAGVLAQIVRFSNVFGSTDDHSDRVVPAYARASAHGGAIRVDGADNTFDFTHVSDVADGLFKLVEATRAGERLPPIHFLTGRGTSLGQLADMAVEHARQPVAVNHAPERDFDVSHFYGDPARAKALLDWEARVPIDQGFAQLVDDFSKIPAEQGEASHRRCN